ncbi:MAG TPA: restriction endonuclease subunit S [Candidatus Cloacimonadota bacterium]|nr:restriction endonuclease subunit S [Candidatus Cloacimonadota bacterium]
MRKALLKEVAAIQMGYQARTRLEPVAESDYTIILGKDISAENEIDVSNLVRIDLKTEDSKFLLQRKDVLFMAKGTSNLAVYPKQSLHNTVASGSFYAIRITVSDMEPGYLAWWLNQRMAQEYFAINRSSGATLSFITAEALRNTPILIPEIEMQRKIVKLAELYSQMKNKTKKLLELQSDLINTVTYRAIIKEEKA